MCLCRGAVTKPSANSVAVSLQTSDGRIRTWQGAVKDFQSLDTHVSIILVAKTVATGYSTSSEYRVEIFKTHLPTIYRGKEQFSSEDHSAKRY